MRRQTSLEVEAESTGRLIERPSISVTVTVMGFFVLVAYYGTKKEHFDEKVMLSANGVEP